MDNTSTKAASGGGISLFTVMVILELVFIPLKLTGAIAWPWVWVLAPLWIWGILFALAIILFFVAIAVLKGTGNL